MGKPGKQNAHLNFAERTSFVEGASLCLPVRLFSTQTHIAHATSQRSDRQANRPTTSSACRAKVVVSTHASAQETSFLPKLSTPTATAPFLLSSPCPTIAATTASGGVGSAQRQAHHGGEPQTPQVSRGPAGQPCASDINVRSIDISISYQNQN